jgi:uncharacterized protein (DUF1778 family)
MPTHDIMQHPMRPQPSLAEINIHLRARAADKNLIDQAAELVGSNRSQFMMASALKEAKNVLLDQSTIFADAKTFQKVLAWMDGAQAPTEKAGMKRLMQAKLPWRNA